MRRREIDFPRPYQTKQTTDTAFVVTTINHRERREKRERELKKNCFFCFPFPYIDEVAAADAAEERRKAEGFCVAEL